MTTESVIFDQAKRTEFLQAFGQAVLYWQNVESELASVFCALFRPPSEAGRRAAEAAIHALMANAKLSSVDGAVQMYFEKDDEMLTRWKQLHDLVKSGAEKRNALAHGTWTLQFEIDTVGNHRVTHTVGKHPGKVRKGGRSYDAAVMATTSEEFSSLWVALRHFKERLWARPTEVSTDSLPSLDR